MISSRTVRKALLVASFTVAGAVLAGEQPKDRSSDDVVFFRNGGVQRGEFLEVAAETLRFRVVLRADQPPATITIAIAAVQRIEFAPDPALEKTLAAPDLAHLADLNARWESFKPLLDIPASPAGRLGLAAADMLLSADDPASRQRALEIFQRIERKDWDEERRGRARSGRLRAMIALGRGEEAIHEAERLAQDADSPGVEIEANLLLGNAAFAQLQRLQEEHPRWNEDVFVRPERARLLHRALDHLLHPALFHGWRADEASTGLWAAAGVYRFDGRTQDALELARDILKLYPETGPAEQAQAFLAAHPPPDPKTSIPHEDVE